jgi:hypothetical protein
MVIRLAIALDVPLRQHNALLIAAGFAPVWRQTDLAAPELSQVRSALDFMLAQQEPFPAVAVDRRWNLLQSNSGAIRLVEFLVGPLAPGVPINLADALVAPNVLRPYLVNWTEVVGYFVRSVQADAEADGTAETAGLLKRLLAYQGVSAAVETPPAELALLPILPMHFRKGNIDLKLFTTIATLGIPQDITLQELRIESFFPMDEAPPTFCAAGSCPARDQLQDEHHAHPREARHVIAIDCARQPRLLLRGCALGTVRLVRLDQSESAISSSASGPPPTGKAIYCLPPAM